MKSRSVQFIISLIISLGGLWLAFGYVDWSAFGGALTDGNPGLIALGSVILLAVIPLRGFRWRIFLEPIADVPMRLTSDATLVGYFGNNAMPFRLGELLRSYFVAQRINVPTTQVLGTVIVERVVDFLSALILIAGLPFIGVIPTALRQPLIWVIIISTVMGVATFWLAGRENGIPWLKGRYKRIADNLYLGFTSLRQEHHYLALIFTTVLLWFFYFVSVHVTQQAMGLELSYADSYLLLVIVTIGMMVPAAPGNVGTYHAAVVIALTTIFDIELARAQAAAVILHAISYIPYTIIGAVIYLRAHLHIGDIQALELNPASKNE